MFSVARGFLRDNVITNHSCSITTTTEGMSDNVFVNAIGIHRQTDLNTAHTVSPPSCPLHQTMITIGSERVFANNLGVARVGDLYNGGEQVSSGSENVFAG